MGDVTVVDEGRRGKRRVLRVKIDLPGYGLPTRALLEYTEWYERAGKVWRLDSYAYELRAEPGPSRRAHHLHAPLGAHQHCVDPRRPSAPHHYEGFEVVLEQAHEEFRTIAASEEPISCAGLRRLPAMTSASPSASRSS